MVPVPAAHWQEADSAGSLGSLVREAASASRRIDKGVNLESERPRYHAACRFIEQFAWTLLSDGCESEAEHPGDPAMALTDRLYDRLSLGGSDDDDLLGQTFCCPADVPHYRDQLMALRGRASELKDVLRERIQYVERLIASGQGFIEVPVLEPSAVDDGPGRIETSQGPETVTESKLLEVPVAIGDGFSGLSEKLWHDCLDALPLGGVVNLGVMPHNVVTEVLHRLTHTPGLAGGLLWFAHADGSSLDRFAVGTLGQAATLPADDRTNYRVALMSMRHLSLDEDVDWAWYRNVDVSRARSLAESERFCLEHSRRQLSAMLTYAPLHIDLYHTGFAPAVMGFYRALTECQAAGAQVSVRPLYYAGPKGYVAGEAWLPISQGGL